MFTGIITDITTIISHEQTAEGLKLVFARPASWSDLMPGESINTNGVCLTIAEYDDNSYTCLLIPETLRISTFGNKTPGRVNVERSMRVGDRLSGHIVQGHIDSTGIVGSIEQDAGHSIVVKIEEKFMKYIASKGSVTIDGVSLTVATIRGDGFSVALVPHTLSHTTLSDLNINDTVNLEFDALAKYVEQLLRKETR